MDGEELIVHRKGATPASEGQLGIIPGSMTSKGFIVKGREMLLLFIRLLTEQEENMLEILLKCFHQKRHERRIEKA